MAIRWVGGKDQSQWVFHLTIGQSDHELIVAFSPSRRGCREYQHQLDSSKKTIDIIIGEQGLTFIKVGVSHAVTIRLILVSKAIIAHFSQGCLILKKQALTW